MNTKLGQYHVAEPLSMLGSMHIYTGGELKEVDHEPKLAVLDQEDLIEQGIDTSKLIPGAPKVDALGSCVFNAATAMLSNTLGRSEFRKVVADYNNTAKAERFAIMLYHATTDLTGASDTEWPPTDCGSSGLFVCRELQAQEIISGHVTAIPSQPQSIISLMQKRQGLIVGGPWFNSWFDPDANGFVDGDGSTEALQAAINSGVAGGHERYVSAVETLVMDETGKIDPNKTVLRERNSWSASWGDHGSYRIHLSTHLMLARYVDFRQMHLHETPGV